MISILKEVNWCVMLKLKDNGGFKSTSSTFIRKVRVNPIGTSNFLVILVEMDGEGKYEFSGEFRFGLTDDEIQWVMREYYKTNEWIIFNGRSKKTELVSKTIFLKKLLEGKDFTDNTTTLYHSRFTI